MVDCVLIATKGKGRSRGRLRSTILRGIAGDESCKSIFSGDEWGRGWPAKPAIAGIGKTEELYRRGRRGRGGGRNRKTLPLIDTDDTDRRKARPAGSRKEGMLSGKMGHVEPERVGEEKWELKKKLNIGTRLNVRSCCAATEPSFIHASQEITYKDFHIVPSRPGVECSMEFRPFA